MKRQRGRPRDGARRSISPSTDMPRKDGKERTYSYSDFLIPATVFVVRHQIYPSAESTRITSMSTKIPADRLPESSNDHAPPNSPCLDTWTPHHLSANPGTEFTVPTSLLNAPSFLPARRQDPPYETGLVNHADIICNHFLQTKVEAHAVTRDKFRRVNEGDSGMWLDFTRGEPLWILKESIPKGPTNHRNARLLPPPRALKMVSLQTGRHGLVPLTMLILHPQAKVSGKEVLYMPREFTSFFPPIVCAEDIIQRAAGHSNPTPWTTATPSLSPATTSDTPTRP